MKKLSLILAGALLLGGISFAAPLLKQTKQAPAAKSAPAKPVVKKHKGKKPPVKKDASATKAAK